MGIAEQESEESEEESEVSTSANCNQDVGRRSSAQTSFISQSCPSPLLKQLSLPVAKTDDQLSDLTDSDDESETFIQPDTMHDQILAGFRSLRAFDTTHIPKQVLRDSKGVRAGASC